MTRLLSSNDTDFLAAAVRGYEHELERVDARMREISAEIEAKRQTASAPDTTIPVGGSGKYVRTDEARRRIALGQRRRWAAYRRKQSASRSA